MSSYAEFYLKFGEQWVCIGEYSRSSHIYQAAEDYLPYEAGKPVTLELLRAWVSDLEFEINLWKQSIQKYELMKREVGTWNNTIDEKMEAVEQYQNSIDSFTEELNGDESALALFKSWELMLDQIELDNSYIGSLVKPDNFLWAGIEWDPEYEEDE